MLAAIARVRTALAGEGGVPPRAIPTFRRLGRWGTCVDCPRPKGATYPDIEHCPNTDRYDHRLRGDAPNEADTRLLLAAYDALAAAAARICTPEDLAEIKARAEAATAGPWRTGRTYLRMGANDGGEWLRGTHAVNFPHGRCLNCRSAVEPCALTEESDGRTFHIAVFDDPGTWVKITSDATHGAITGVDDNDQGGVMLRADAEFTAHARTDIPALLAYVTANEVACLLEREAHARLVRAIADRKGALESVMPQRVRAYLAAHGWEFRQEDETFAIYAMGANLIDVPLEPQWRDYARRLWEVAKSVGSVEARDPAFVLAEWLDGSGA